MLNYVIQAQLKSDTLLCEFWDFKCKPPHQNSIKHLKIEGMNVFLLIVSKDTFKHYVWITYIFLVFSAYSSHPPVHGIFSSASLPEVGITKK